MDMEQMAVLNNIHNLTRAALEAEHLLASIWHELGPYTDKLSPDLLKRLNDYFKFDDGE